MKKLRLDPAALAVQSFPAMEKPRREEGTVIGHVTYISPDPDVLYPCDPGTGWDCHTWRTCTS